MPARPQRLISKISFITVVLLTIVQIVISNQLATAGINLRQLEIASLQLTEENHQLNQKITQLTAMEYLSTQANQLGLTEQPRVTNLNPGLALNQP